MLSSLLSQHRKSLPLSLSTATTCCEIWGWTFSVQNSEATISSSNLEGCIQKCYEKRAAQASFVELPDSSEVSSQRSFTCNTKPASHLHRMPSHLRSDELGEVFHEKTAGFLATRQFMVAQKHVALNVGWDVCPRHFHLGDLDP